jgi:hypothetical protein
MSYVAGCRDSGVGARSDLYDVLVNLPAREITVATHAKGNNIAVILSKHEEAQILCFWTLSIALSLSKNTVLFIFQNTMCWSTFIIR